MNSKKTKDWLKRYGLAEIITTGSILLTTSLVYHFTSNLVLSAIVGTITDNLAYYGTILLQDLIQRAKKHEKITLIGTFVVLRNMVLEFGVGEALDSILIRPLAMYWFPVWIGDHTLGILMGKITADIAFYIPTVVSYELRKKHFKD